MKTHEKKFEEIYNLLKEKLGERVIFSQGHETKFLELKDSKFWLSMNNDELTVGFGVNHSHFSENYDNLENGIIRVFDLLTNQIKTTLHIKGDYIYKEITEIIYSNGETVNIGKSSILFYPFWKKKKIITKYSDVIIEKNKIELEFNKI